MCGIAGFTGDNDLELLKSMTNILSHRGPDGEGFYTDKNISLGHRRLSIIDLSSAGKQPMSNENEDIWITYNGEIYNFKELRKELESYGHRFKSNTDTEVIIHGYEQWGKEVLQKLNGMFAFAIWDSTKKELFIARDKVGIKPLYYTLIDNNIVFASEMKAILLHPLIKKVVNKQSLGNFLTYRYVPEPETIFENIYKLLPGNFLTFDLSKSNNTSKKLNTQKYWRLSFDSAQDIDEKMSIKEIRKTLLNSVERRLMADVPVGVFLSGGLDSSSIVAMMNKLNISQIKTFSIGYEVKEEEDEINKARFVADYFSTDHSEIIINSQPLEILPKVLWHLDEPLADPTAIPTYFLSEHARKKVKVVLSGEGADEVFGGYEQYKIMMLAQKYFTKMPSFIRSTIPLIYKTIPSSIIIKFFKYARSLGKEGQERFFSFLKYYKGNFNDYSKIITIFTEQEKKNFCNFETKNSVEQIKPFFNNNNNLFNKMLLTDFNMFLRHLLLKTDKMTMAHGLEARVPFLDIDVVNVTSKISPKLKMNGQNEKFILKKALYNSLPKQIIKRKKQRFFVPIDYWFKNILKDNIKNLLSEKDINKRGYFNHDYIKKIFQGYNQSPLYYGRQLWNLLCLESWFKIYLDQDKITKSRLKFDKLN